MLASVTCLLRQEMVLKVLSSPPPGSWTPYHPLGPPSHTPPTYPQPFSAPPTPSPVNVSPEDRLCAELEHSFAQNLFHGIVPNTTNSSSRARFHWPFEVTAEQQLLLMIRCMRQAGFDSLGDFGLALLSKETQFHTNSPVALSLSAFVRCKSQDSRTHPVALVDLLFNHRFAQEYVDHVPIEPAFTLPRYALPPSQRLRSSLPSLEPHMTTRNALLNWSLMRVLDRIDVEVPRLFKPGLGLVRTPSMPISWSSILKWDLTEAQETIALTTPALFSLATTISVSDRSRKALDAAANPPPPPPPPSTSTTPPQDSSRADLGDIGANDDITSSTRSSTADCEVEDGDTDSESEEAELDVFAGLESPRSTGVPPSMRRDPWLVSVLCLSHCLIVLICRLPGCDRCDPRSPCIPLPLRHCISYYHRPIPLHLQCTSRHHISSQSRGLLDISAINIFMSQSIVYPLRRLLTRLRSGASVVTSNIPSTL